MSRQFRSLSHPHLAVWGSELDEETALWESRTSQSCISIAAAFRTTLRGSSGDRKMGRRRPLLERARAGSLIAFTLEQGTPVTIKKTVAAAISGDRAVPTAVLEAGQWILRAPLASMLLSAHMLAWDELWDSFRVEHGAERAKCRALDLNTFHVLQTVAAAGAELDAGVPARGLHGEGYRGHIFWDELCVHPMRTLRQPELTKWLLLYCHRRLGGDAGSRTGCGPHRGKVSVAKRK